MTISHNFEAGNKTSNQLAGGQAINETLEMFKHFFFHSICIWNESKKKLINKITIFKMCANRKVRAKKRCCFTYKNL